MKIEQVGSGVVVNSSVPVKITPAEARSKADELTEAARKAEKWTEFDSTPGTIYRDQFGDLYMVATSEGIGLKSEEDNPWMWKLKDGEAGYTLRSSWERNYKIKFSRIHTAAGTVLKADGGQEHLGG